MRRYCRISSCDLILSSISYSAKARLCSSLNLILSFVALFFSIIRSYRLHNKSILDLILRCIVGVFKCMLEAPSFLSSSGCNRIIELFYLQWSSSFSRLSCSWLSLVMLLFKLLQCREPFRLSNSDSEWKQSYIVYFLSEGPEIFHNYNK
jgi:hypothetical protein